MAIEMPVALLLLHPLARPYKSILVPGVPLVCRTLLSLGRGRSTRHATLLTQSDFRVSEVGAGGASAQTQYRSIQGVPAQCSRRKGERISTSSLVEEADLGAGSTSVGENCTCSREGNEGQDAAGLKGENVCEEVAVCWGRESSEECEDGCFGVLARIGSWTNRCRSHSRGISQRPRVL